MTPSSAESSQASFLPAQSVPLAVDLDGTLIKTDLLVEALFALIKRNPLYLVKVVFWLLRGRACLKRETARRIALDAGTLPYRPDLLDYLKAQHSLGRKLVLATGSNEQMANCVADYLRIFDGVIASDGTDNLSGRRKLHRLVGEFGAKMFDYAGNNRGDLPVWSSARRAIVVNGSAALCRKVAGVCEVERVFERTADPFAAYLRALRPYQWLKNILVFVPPFVGGALGIRPLFRESAAFLAFSLCASSLYLINDLIDLNPDRRHPHKRERPFASGELSPLWGLLTSPVLLALSFLLGALLLPLSFLATLAVYCALDLVYSLWLKQVALLDVIILAGFYTLRLIAGSTAIAQWPSPWLLAFSTFLFVSLALVKRYGELAVMGLVDGQRARARAYWYEDKDLLASMGIGSGYLAVLVLVIYISTGQAEIHYSRHQFVWLLCPTLLYWISHVWLSAHRCQMCDDPLVFTLSDTASRAAMVVVVVLVLLAR
jgi:4-hydroxybenzoate polyprenyltransferase/phosphoserine phosphatase